MNENVIRLEVLRDYQSRDFLQGCVTHDKRRPKCVSFAHSVLNSGHTQSNVFKFFPERKQYKFE